MKNWEKKLLSFVLTLVMTAVIIPTLFATPAYAVASTSWTKLGGSTGGQTIGTNGQTKYYYIDANTTCSNTNNGGSGLTIAAGATVYIYIPANVTLTCTGKAGSGVTGGGAGIWLPSNSKLYIIGNGKIVATGGAAAAGSNGGAGQKASTPFVRSGYSTDGTHNALLINSGSGGNGGNGGGGAGAGIGTPGGAGGAGGAGGKGFGANGNPTAEMLLHVAYTGGGWNPNGGAWGSVGSAGTKGTAGAAMGTLGIQTTITQSIKGGAANGTAGQYTNYSLGYDTDVVWNADRQYRWISMPGGGGGGGGSGYAAANIGAGGGGGGGGGGGRAGGVSYTNAIYAPFYASYVGGGGTGNATGTGSTTKTQYYNTGFSPDNWDATNGWAKGGAGTGAGTAKAAGTATLGAKVTYNPQNGTATWADNNVTVGVAMPSTTKPTYNGFTFAGWYDDPVGGTQYYNANNASVRPMINCDITLYAHWTTNNGINVANQTQIIDAFKWAPTNNTAITINMSSNIDVNYALNAGIIEYAGQNITLNLNGKTLRQIGSAHTDIIKLAGACTLHIKDSVGGGNLTRSTANTSMSAIWLNDANANFYLDSGTITGCYSAYWGAAVCVDYGHFYMTGGTISNCSVAQYGGAVSVKNGGSFAMSGGTITGCSAKQYGGGVYCQPSCTFAMTGGTISDCTAGTSGGGMDLDGPLTISGGVIENCKAATYGGGLYVHSSCTGGTISDNFIIRNCTANNYGGGVYSIGVLTMKGGVIEGCTATTGGGGVYAGGTFNMQGGVIWDNLVLTTASGVGKGGGIVVGGTTTMTGGYIINNTVNRNVAYGGVGVFGNCTFNMQGGIIWGNKHNGGSAISGVGTDDNGHYNKTGGLVDPAIDLTLENPLAPIVHITMKEDITLTDVRSADGTVLTTADSIDFVGNQNVTWDLNGHTLDLNKYHYILVDAGATFTLKDSGKGGNITNGCAGYYYGSSGMGYSNAWRNWGGAVYVRGATFNMESGIIQNCTTRHFGGGVAVWGGTFNMTGGTIQNCTTYTTSDKIGSESGGGGVYIHSNSSFTMTNGTIKDCSSITFGGGVASNGIFEMTGSTISGCVSTTHSGGVFNGGMFNFSGGTITGCTAGTTGGGVDTNGVFNMTNGIIENCTSNGGDLGNGGGVFVWSSGSFTMTDSIIRNCKATSVIAPQGKGGAVHSYGPFTMKGNSLIYGNTSLRPTVEAPGVSLTNGGVFNLQSGIVYGNWNTADNVRAGLYTEGTGTLNQTGGYIDPKTVITLDPNGGTAGTETVTVYYGDTAMPVIEKLPTRANHTFSGFYDAAEGGKQYYDAEGKDVSGLGEGKMWEKLDATMTLYSRWTENTATLTYNANGHGTAPEAVTMKTSEATKAAAAITGVTGYTFNGWNTAADGTGTAYAAGAEVKAAGVAPVAITLYAQWTENTAILTYNANGHGTAPEAVTMKTSEATNAAAAITGVTGYIFDSWNTAADGRGTAYAAGAEVKAANADPVATTLYAHWKESAKIESMDLLLGGDIGMRYHVAVNDPELMESGTMTVSIGSKKPSEKTVPYSEAPKDESGAILFPFTVSSIQMAEPVKVEFKDGSGNVITSDAKSVEDYYNLVKGSATTSDDQKEMVRTLVDYGYHAQQALSKTNGWSIGTDYKASTQYGSLSSTANDLKAYKPVISGSDPNVKDIQLSLLLDNKTTLCIYVQTKDGTAPTITVDGKDVSPEKNGDGWWLVRIPDIDALNLSTMHTVTANGYTVYLSALSYASVAGKNTIDAMRALLDYYQATLTANHKKMLTSATVEQSEYEYTGSKIEPVVTAYAGSNGVTGCTVKWNGDLINAGTYTGLVTGDGYVGGVTVKVKINPVKVTAPRAVEGPLTYNGSEQTGVIGTDDEETPADAKSGSEKNEIAPEEALYTLENNTATDAGSYTAKATLNNPENAKNYCWDDGTTEPKTYNWRIDPMKVSVPAVETKEFTYDGNEHAVEILTSDLYTVSGNTGTAAGEYTAIVTLKDKKNNCWNDGTTGDISIPWRIVIVKTKVEKPTVTGETSFAYDGTEKTLVIAASENYTVTGNTGTDAGEYTATVTLNENCCWSDETTEPETISWKITKKEIAVPSYEVKNDLTYTGEEQTGVTVAENAAYTLTDNTGTNAGSYTATLALKDTKNTCWSDEGKTTDAKTIVWSIARKQITVPTAVTGLVYDGSEQTGVNGGEGYTLSGTTKATNAGSYTATATLTDLTNTCWSDGATDAKAIEWSIAKATPAETKPVSVTYHPNGGSAEFSGSMNVDGTFSYDPSNGTTFTPEDTTNYNTVTVEDADVTVDNTATTLTVPLDGNKEETE